MGFDRYMGGVGRVHGLGITSYMDIPESSCNHDETAIGVYTQHALTAALGRPATIKRVQGKETSG